jgi:hypothetical protein
LTKRGIAAAKARGTKLGITGVEHGKNLAAANKAAADEFATNLKSTVEKYLAEGLRRSDIADALNQQKIATARGGRWHTTSVQRMVKRLNLA